ncbi:MAG: hypothetical protein HYT87_11495 [Nitrospirae bacterium]|nr:hypothetical protein [Nitrospirota bacterium]
MTRDAALFRAWAAHRLMELRDDYRVYRGVREVAEGKFPHDAELLSLAREADERARVALDTFERLPLELRVREFADRLKRGVL